MATSPALDIGPQKQLFIDDRMVAETAGLTRNLHQPAKYAGNPVMIPLYPWEGRLNMYGTVHRDPESGRLRMWYQGYGRGGVPSMAKGDAGSPWKGFEATNLLYVVCYAESDDGVHWRRERVGHVEYEGSLDNNIVLSDACPGVVIEDLREPDPDKLYKSLFFEARDPGGTPNMGDGFSVAFSPDGIKWTKYEHNPVVTRSSDSHELFGWDDLNATYVSYCRPTVHEGDRTRRIGRSTSPDFIDWTEPETILAPDEHDPPGTEFYGMPVFPYEGMYLGHLQAYHTPPEEPQIRFAGAVDIQLASSRDGIAWERVADRTAFIPNGPRGSIDQGEVYAAVAPVRIGDELWFYYGASPQEHGVAGRSGTICVAKLRLDGFVSMDAGEADGTLMTQPFVCDGGDLQVNAAARGGSVSVAVLGEDGLQKDGFARIDCTLFDGDSIEHRVTWREHVSLDSLKGQTVSLKFYLRSASLYAFQLE